MAEGALQDSGATPDGAANGQPVSWTEKIFVRLSSNLVAVSAIIGLFVTINQSLTSWSQDNIERYKTFRESVSDEEKYWERLFERLLTVVEETDQESKVRKQKIAIIDAMSQRPIPAFTEHQLGILRWDTAPQKEAKQGIDAIKRSLRAALADERAVGSEQAGVTQLAIYQSEQRDLLQQSGQTVDAARQTAKAEADRVTTANAQAGLTYQAQTLAAGVANGWDIDVFWCAGGDETARFNAGQQVATALAVEANKGTLAGARDFPLGRIRLRALPTALQALDGYPSSGNEVRGEYGNKDRGESARADALVAWLNAGGKPASMGLDGGFRRIRTVMVTPYYISVFVCSTAQAV